MIDTLPFMLKHVQDWPRDVSVTFIDQNSKEHKLIEVKSAGKLRLTCLGNNRWEIDTGEVAFDMDGDNAFYKALSDGYKLAGGQHLPDAFRDPVQLRKAFGRAITHHPDAWCRHVDELRLPR